MLDYSHSIISGRLTDWILWPCQLSHNLSPSTSCLWTPGKLCSFSLHTCDSWYYMWSCDQTESVQITKANALLISTGVITERFRRIVVTVGLLSSSRHLVVLAQWLLRTLDEQVNLVLISPALCYQHNVLSDVSAQGDVSSIKDVSCWADVTELHWC